MTKHELQKWRRQVHAWGPVRDPADLAEALLALSPEDRELVLAELHHDLASEVRAAIAGLEPSPQVAPPQMKRARRRTRSDSTAGVAPREPAPWKLCTQCGFYGVTVTVSGAPPTDPLVLCPECGSPLQEVRLHEIVGRFSPERQEALLRPLARAIAQRILDQAREHDVTT
jgi:hypothetical protein